jgi:hypothetical protein
MSVKYKIDQDKLDACKLEARQKADRDYEGYLESLINIEIGRSKRETKGLKPNKISSDEFRMVIEAWLDDGHKNVSAAFREVFNKIPDKTLNKDHDWPTAMPSSRGFGFQFKQAILSSKHPKVILIKNSRFFDMGSVTNYNTISKRMKEMTKVIEGEEDLLRLEQENYILKTRLERLLGWEIQAEEMLLAGKKQVEICTRFDKSASTVKRLVKRLKEEGVL